MHVFYDKYKRDIRNYDWFSKETTESRDNKNKRMFMHEHLTTSEDFKQELIYLYKQNKLSVEKVKDLIAKQLNKDVSEISEEKELVKDLGADSLDAVELIMAIEEDFGVTISDEDGSNVKTVGDVVKLIDNN